MTKSLIRIAYALIALSFLPTASRGDDDDDLRAGPQTIPAAPAPDNHGNHPVAASNTAAAGLVRLSPEQQRAAGIVVQLLEETSQRLEFSAYAKVVDIQPLLDLSTRQRNLQEELTVSRTALNASQKALERTIKLKRQEAASERSLQQAQVLQAADAARTASTQQQLTILRNEALQRWGPTLSGWALDNPEEGLEKLLMRHEVLVEVSLPPERTLPADTTTLFLARQGDRRHALEARLVSAAPHTGDMTQGETWFFVSPAGMLRTGMRLDAWVPMEAEPAVGVEFPVDAVLWRSGKPWVYVQTGDGSFSRRVIPAYRDHGASWFVSSGVKAGERLVVGGAQMLLSEEFRGQIPDEDN